MPAASVSFLLCGLSMLPVQFQLSRFGKEDLLDVTGVTLHYSMSAATAYIHYSKNQVGNSSK
jgi:hypothetical protein